MIKKVLSFIEEHHMIEQCDHIIAGVSGGADSVCLLILLDQLRKIIDFELTVIHVEHGLRGLESLADAMFVEELCNLKGLPLKTFYCQALEHAKNNGLTVEEAGRELRYSYFRTAAVEFGANKIAIAHNQNDVAETMLFHLMRGTGLKGLCGILPVRDEIIRPLLCLSRNEIENYLGQINQEFRTDKTNLEVDYTRNKIRAHIVPVMEKINPNAVLHMFRTSEIVASAINYMDWSVSQALIHYTQQEEGVLRVDAALTEEHPAIQQMTILQGIKALTEQSKDIKEIHIKKVLELFQKPMGKQLNLPNKVLVKRSEAGIVFLLRADEKQAKYKSNHSFVPNKVLELGKVINLPELNYRIQTEIIINRNDFPEIEKKPYTKWFDYDKIKGNVQVRTRQSGDYLVIDKNGKKQKLKKYFINEKIPEAQRDQILLFADQDQILWVVGYRISENIKVTEDTRKILKVQIYGGRSYE